MGKTFVDEFNERMDSIEARAAKLGLSWNDVCAQAKVARATPVRYRARAPLSVKIVAKMEEIVSAHEQAQQQAQQQS